MGSMSRCIFSALVILVAVCSVAKPASAAEFRTLSGQGSDSDSSWDKWLESVRVEYEKKQQQSVLGVDETMTTQAAPKGKTIYVNKQKGPYRTVQQAVNAVPKGNTKRIVIYIPDGVYKEKILVPKTKPFITFQCQSRKATLVWGDTAAKAGGTAKSASTAIESKGFIAYDCTFANSAPAPPGGAVGKQAVALRIQGDQGAFYRCAFLGAQDTLYDKEGRHYFRDCYIRGSIDFVFGDGQSIYKKCLIESIAKGTSGSITAQKRESFSRTGFVFDQCTIRGSGSIYLGRAWGTHSRVVFCRCNMANIIRPIGWQDWDDKRRQKTVFYAEYACTGPGANRKGRAPWSKVLSAAQAKPFLDYGFIDAKQ